ncbi:hypothetical protein DMUE_2926 [Dictyocoela muelleri]|nr:hypothetical protein DMUE_2926 [Dictyocoela muelleri]
MKRVVIIILVALLILFLFIASLLLVGYFPCLFIKSFIELFSPTVHESNSNLFIQNKTMNYTENTNDNFSKGAGVFFNKTSEIFNGFFQMLAQIIVNNSISQFQKPFKIIEKYINLSESKNLTETLNNDVEHLRNMTYS